MRTTACVMCDDDLIGLKVGSYEVVKLIGAGGMGRVYQAVHPAIGSRVAIKVLSAELGSQPRAVKRFFDEARAVGIIAHENIINILDLATLPDGRPYILMEHLNGQSVDEHLAARGRLPTAEAIRITDSILYALSAAHARAIVHRDIKPANVFVTEGGQVKVLDFGIAKLHEPGVDAELTTTANFVGTPSYMSPEQACGLSVDARTDIYAVGLVLYEMLTGVRAFDADSLYEVLKKQVEVLPRPVDELAPDLDRGIVRVVSKALRKDPQTRFQTAIEFRSALAQPDKFAQSDAFVNAPTIAHQVDVARPQLQPATTPLPVQPANTPSPFKHESRRQGRTFRRCHVRDRGGGGCCRGRRSGRWDLPRLT